MSDGIARGIEIATIQIERKQAIKDVILGVISRHKRCSVNTIIEACKLAFVDSDMTISADIVRLGLDSLVDRGFIYLIAFEPPSPGTDNIVKSIMEFGISLSGELYVKSQLN